MWLKIQCVTGYRPTALSSIHNGGSGTDPPLGAVLDPMAAPILEMHMDSLVPHFRNGQPSSGSRIFRSTIKTTKSVVPR